MKSISLIVFACLFALSVNAQPISTQTTAKPVTRTSDTAINRTPTHIKTRIIGGAEMSSAHDIVDNISRSKDHTILTGAIVACSLSETFKSRGPITIFAPTNAAFNKLPAGTLDTLLKPAHSPDLTRLLTYHAVAGKLTSKEIAKQITAGKGVATFTTIAGSPLKAKINGNRNIVLIDENGNESVISQFDVEQSNGLIDVITTVLTPKSK